MRLVRLARSSILFVIVLTLGELTALLWLWVGFHGLPILITKIIGSFGWHDINDSSKLIPATHAMKMIKLSNKLSLRLCAPYWDFELVLAWLSLMA